MDSNGQNQQALTTDSLDQRRPSWHPDGKSIVYEEVTNNSLISYDLSSGNQGVILDQKKLNKYVLYGKMQFARYDPKGERIVFTLVESDTVMNLVIFDVKLTTLEEVFINPYRTAYASWGEKGNLLIFHSRHNTQNISDDIYSLNQKNNSINRLTSWKKHDFCPMFSPDGKKIAFVRSMENTRPEIMVMNSDGTGQVQLTNNTDGETLPNWAPTGDKLLITAFRNGHFQICELKIP